MIYAFDLDSTLTKEETLPFLAKKLNISNQYDELSSKIRHFPYTPGLIKRLTLFQYYSPQKISEILADIPIFLNLRDFILKNRENSCIITSNIDTYVEALCDQFGCKVYASKLRPNDIVFIDKAAIIFKLKKKDKVAYTGDGANDAAALKLADFSFAASYVKKADEAAIDGAKLEVFSTEKLIEELGRLEPV